MNKLEWNSTHVEQHGKVPEPGEIIDYIGDKWVVCRVNVVNGSKVELKVDRYVPVKQFNDHADRSVEWDEIDESYLPNYD